MIVLYHVEIPPKQKVLFVTAAHGDKMDPLRTKVALAALYSRLFIWAFSIVSNLFIPDHDAGDA